MSCTFVIKELTPIGEFLSEFYLRRCRSINMVREKRKKLEIYNDILQAIMDEYNSGEIKPTRVQYRCNMSYDKMTNYLNELETKKLIQNNPLSITTKGQRFLEDYSKIKEFTDKMNLEYLLENEVRHE